MEWPKLKNIILAILVVTDLLLLSLVGLRSWNSSRYLAGARKDALQVLEQNGIHMQETVLAKDTRVPVATVTRDRQVEEERLALLLGERLVDAPESGETVYAGEKGSARLGGRWEFQISLGPEAYPVAGELADHALELMEQLGIQAEVLSSKGDAQNGEVILLQQWEGLPIRNCRIEVRYEGTDRPILLSGTRISGTPLLGGELEMSAVTGLLRFLEEFEQTGDICTEILTMQPGYQLTNSLSGPSVLVPIWYFVTDTASYALDLTTNQLNKL